MNEKNITEQFYESNKPEYIQIIVPINVNGLKGSNIHQHGLFASYVSIMKWRSNAE